MVQECREWFAPTERNSSKRKETAVMDLVIHSGPVTATNLLRDVPQEKWRDLMVARRCFMHDTLSYDCSCLLDFVNDAKKMYEVLGFASVEEMIRDGYGLEPDEINVAVKWLELNPPDTQVSLDEAITLGKQGRPRKGEEKKRYPIRIKYGTSREEIIARLKKQNRYDLAVKVLEGGSAKAMAREAGQPGYELSTPMKEVLKQYPKLTIEELLEAITEANNELAKRLAAPDNEEHQSEPALDNPVGAPVNKKVTK